MLMAAMPDRGFCFILLAALLYCSAALGKNFAGSNLAEATFPEGSPNHCNPELAGSCVVDNYIGNKIIFEDSSVTVWNFTLGPGETTSMHRHECGYHFLAVTSSDLEVWGEYGEMLMTITPTAGKVIGFALEGEELVQTASENPIRIPRTHAARNVGQHIFNELLFEYKLGCEKKSFSTELRTSELDSADTTLFGGHNSEVAHGITVAQEL
jgi:quercetin dioxygenase-like cupin family protein